MFNSDSDKPRKEGKDHMSPSIQGNGFQFAFSVQSGRILCMRIGCVLLSLYSTEHKAAPGDTGTQPDPVGCLEGTNLSWALAELD